MVFIQAVNAEFPYRVPIVDRGTFAAPVSNSLTASAIPNTLPELQTQTDTRQKTKIGDCRTLGDCQPRTTPTEDRSSVLVDFWEVVWANCRNRTKKKKTKQNEIRTMPQSCTCDVNLRFGGGGEWISQSDTCFVFLSVGRRAAGRGAPKSITHDHRNDCGAICSSGRLSLVSGLQPNDPRTCSVKGSRNTAECLSPCDLIQVRHCMLAPYAQGGGKGAVTLFRPQRLPKLRSKPAMNSPVLPFLACSVLTKENLQIHQRFPFPAKRRKSLEHRGKDPF